MNDVFDALIGNWKEELQKYISPDQLPQAFGGDRCEPDPWCSNYVSCYIMIFVKLALCSMNPIVFVSFTAQTVMRPYLALRECIQGCSYMSQNTNHILTIYQLYTIHTLTIVSTNQHTVRTQALY